MPTYFARRMAQSGMDLLAKHRFKQVYQGQTIHLHIGMSKTGTTYIQQVFEKNRSVLKQQGLLFPPITMRAGGFSAGHTDLLSLKSQLNGKDLLNWVSDELENTTNIRNILFSSEYLVAKPDQLERLKKLFEDFDVQVIVYLRRQDEWLDSIYKEHTEGRHSFNTLRAERFAEEQQILELDYEKLLKPIVDIFGQESIAFRVYEQEQLKQGLLCDFAQLVDVDPQVLSTTDIPSNPSAALEDVELMRILNKLSYSGKSNYDEFAMEVMQILYEDTHKKKKALSPSVRIKVLDRYKQSNKRFANQYFGRENLFFAPLPDPNEPWEAVSQVKLNRLEQLIDALVPFLR